MFNGVSTNDNSQVQIQLGAGSIQTSGYLCGAFSYNSSSADSSTSGLILDQGGPSGGAGASRSGFATIVLFGSNFWTYQGNLYTPNVTLSSGSVPLSGTLDRLRITTVTGTALFDAGSVNIMYE
jgi:hypothetical protein